MSDDAREVREPNRKGVEPIEEIGSEGFLLYVILQRGSFIILNCAALLPELLKSKLFGHEPASFS